MKLFKIAGKSKELTLHPLQEFQESWKFISAYYNFIGQNILAEKFYRSKNCYTIFLLVLILISFLAIDLMFTDDLGDAIRVIQACMLVGLVQLSIKFYWLKDLHVLRQTIAFLENIYRVNSQPTDSCYGICCRYARITELMIQLIAASNMGIVVFANLSALVESFLTMTPLHFVFYPFVHEYSLGQLIMLDAFTAIAALSSIVVIPAGDLFFYLVVANFTMIPLIVASQMDELSARLELCQANVMEIKRRLVQYIMIHQEYNRY